MLLWIAIVIWVTSRIGCYFRWCYCKSTGMHESWSTTEVLTFANVKNELRPPPWKSYQDESCYKIKIGMPSGGGQKLSSASLIRGFSTSLVGIPRIPGYFSKLQSQKEGVNPTFEIGILHNFHNRSFLIYGEKFQLTTRSNFPPMSFFHFFTAAAPLHLAKLKAE